MKHNKMTCFTSMVLVGLLTVSSVVGGSVSVFANNSDSENDSGIEVISETPETDNEQITIDENGITVSQDDLGISVESTEQTSTVSVALREADDSDISIEKTYVAGDKIPVVFKASNTSDKDVEVRMYLWNDKDATLDTKYEDLKNPADSVKIAEADKDGKVSFTLSNGDKVVGNVVTSKADDKVTEYYVSVTLPAGTSLESDLNLVSDKDQMITVVPMLMTEPVVAGDVSQYTWVAAEDEKEDVTSEPEKDEAEIVIETETPEDGFASVFMGDKTEETKTLNASDFASMRLVVVADDKSKIPNESDIIGSYGNFYLIQFTSIQQTMNAYVYFKDLGLAVEPDMTISVAGDDIELIVNQSEIPMDETQNPMAALNEATPSEPVQNEHGVIALIDTGVKEHANVIDRVSVVDDNLEGNGHGDKMVEAIVSQDEAAKILSIRAMDDNGFGTISSLVAAMEYAIDQKVDIINLSLYARTTLSTSVLKEEIQKAVDAGITVVGAAGNDGADVVDYVPGSVDSAWIIGAAKEDGSRLETSNFGETVDYNVVGGTTSEATALFTGFISANGLDGVEPVLNQGLIYATDFKDTEEPETPFEDEDFSKYELVESKVAGIRYTYVKADKVTSDDTINSLFFGNQEDYLEKVYTTTIMMTEVYDAGDGTYKFKANGPLMNGQVVGGEYTDVIFSEGNNNGEVITDGMSIDRKTGIVTVDKELMDKSRGEDDFCDVQVQVLVPTEDIPVARQTLTVENVDGSTYEKKIEIKGFGQQKIPLAIKGSDRELTADDFEVRVNGNQLTSYFTWDAENSEIVMSDYAAGIYQIDIKVKTDVDAMFVAADAGYRGYGALFYLPKGTNVAGLYVGKSQDAATIVGHSSYPAYPQTSTFLGTPITWVPGGSTGGTPATMGYFGIPTNLFGINFRASDANGNPYPLWQGSWNYGQYQFSANRAIHAFCNHLAGVDRPSGQMVMHYQILDKWQSGKYTYFTMTCITNDGFADGVGGGLSQHLGGLLNFAVEADSDTNITVVKEWDDYKNEFDTRPKYDSEGNLSTDADAKPGIKVTLEQKVGGQAWKEYETVLLNDANGWTKTWSKLPKLKSGTEYKYRLKEHESDLGGLYTITYNPSNATSGDVSGKTVTIKNKVKDGWVHLVKSSGNPDVTNGNNCYDLAGAQYTYYSKKTGKAVATVTTDSNGDTPVTLLTPGDYYVIETKTTTDGHYEWNQTFRHDFTITPKHTKGSPYEIGAEQGAVNMPGNDPMGITMTKIWNGVKTDTVPSLAGTQFTIQYFDNMNKDTSGTPKRTWIIELKKVKDIYLAGLTDEYLVAGSDPLYKDPDTGVTWLPYGTYKIWESKAAPDYTLDGTLSSVENPSITQSTRDPYITLVDKDGSAVSLQGGNEYLGKNEPVPMSLTVKKFDENNKPLAGVTFTLKSKSGYAEKQPGWKGSITTGSDGIARWDNLYPDVYTITEAKTPDGKNILKDPIVVELPGRMTKAEAQKYGLKDPDSNNKLDGVVWDPYENVYFINDPVFEVTNDVKFAVPMTGGVIDFWRFMPLIGGFTLIGGLGLYGYTRKRRRQV